MTIGEAVVLTASLILAYAVGAATVLLSLR
jgi:hypothetical protein